jgi:very-short-patch-repair endonuclease
MRGLVRGTNIKRTRIARRLRQSDNDAESAMWAELRDRRPNGLKFVRQMPIGRYFADLACREKRLVIEVDGSQHADSKSDRVRDQDMVHFEWSVLRFWNIDVLKERNAVLETILAAVDGELEADVVAHDLRFTASPEYRAQRSMLRAAPHPPSGHLLPVNGEKE